jgi:polar amino acid transport system substrate-binding protein
VIGRSFIIFLIFTLFLPIILTAQNLTILYEQRKPYVEEDTNSLKGLVATPIIKALEQANINYILKQKPSKRHLFEIKANNHAICAIGWFKNNEREKFAKFTKTVYQDKPMGIIKRKSNHMINGSMDIDTLLQQNIKLLGKKSYSYGKFIDSKTKQYSIKRLNVSSDNIKMLTLIAKKRADFLFISFEEAYELLKNHPLKDSLEFIHLQNMPKGNKRYLICSKKVNDTIITMINNFL